MRRGRTRGCHKPAGTAEARDRHVIQSLGEAVVAGSAEGARRLSPNSDLLQVGVGRGRGYLLLAFPGSARL